MVPSDKQPTNLPRFWAEVRDPDIQPDWSLPVVVVAALVISVAIAAGLGDSSRTLYTAFPALLCIAVGLAVGPRAGAAVGLITTALVTVAAIFAGTPLAAAFAFFGVLLWLTIPSRFAPSGALAPLLQLAYFMVAAFGPQGTTWIEALLYAGAGLLGGLLLLALIGIVRTRAHDESAPSTPEDPTAGQQGDSGSSGAVEADPGLSPVNLLGPVLAAGVSAALLYWRLVSGSQDAAWVLLTFVLVLQPTSLATTVRSLGRVGGTIIGFLLVIVLSFLPSDLSTAVGLAALVPSIAYAKRDYVVSVAATTIVVVTIYGAPTGEYLAWGLARMVDTAVGAALAMAVSAVVRRIDSVRTRTA